MVAAHSPSALRVLRFAARPGELPWRLDHEHGGPGPQRERARSRTCDQGPGSSPTSIERPGVVAGPLRCGGRSETRACRGRSARCRALGEWGSAGCEGEHRVKPRIDDDRGGRKPVKLSPSVEESGETRGTPGLASHEHSGARSVVPGLCSALTHAPILGGESCPSPKFPRHVSRESRVVRLSLPHDIGGSRPGRSKTPHAALKIPRTCTC